LKIKLSSFLKNIASTTITSLLTIIAMIFITRLLAKGLGPEEFGAYSLARRIISNIVPLTTLSVDIALVRYIAMTKNRKQLGAYLVSSSISTGVASALILIIVISTSQQLSYLIFHSHEYLRLYYTSFFLVIGYSVFIIAYAFFRGMQKFNLANALQLIVMALLPLIIVYVLATKKDSSTIVFYMGLAFFFSFFSIPFITKHLKTPRIEDVKTSFKTLLKYSLPRIPAGFALAGLLTLGPFLSGYFWGLKESGYFVVAQSVFRVMEAAVVGFGLVALPKISQLHSEEKPEALKPKIEDILIMIFHVAVYVSIHTFLWSKEIILVWLGSDYMEAIPIMKIIILSLSPFLGYVILRSVVDAIEVRAVNTKNLFISLIAAVLVSLLCVFSGLGILGLAIGTTLGFIILGILTSLYLIKRYKITFKYFLFWKVLLLNVFLATIILIVKHNLLSILNQNILLFTGLAIELGLFSLYLYFFYKNKSTWILELKKRIFYFSPS